MSEGLEVKEFWQNLGGTKTYLRFSSSSKIDYLPASLYSATNALNKITFKRIDLIKKEDLDSKACYLLVHMNQVSGYYVVVVLYHNLY